MALPTVSFPGFRSRIAWQQALWAFTASAFGVSAVLLPPAVLGIGIALLIGLAQPTALLILTLIAAPLKTLIETESHIAFDPGQWALALTLAVWVAHRIATRRPLFRWSAVYVPILMILLAASLSLFVAEAPSVTLTELAKWLEMLVVAALVVTICVEQGWHWPVAGLIGAAVAQAVIGLYQFFGGSGAAHLWILDFRYFRAFGTFGQPNPFGAFMGLTFPLAIGLACYVDKKRRALLLVLIGSALLLTAGLIASWSRGAWLGVGAALLMMLAFAPRRRWVGALLVIGVVSSVSVSSVLGILPASLTSRLSDIGQELTGLQDVRGQVIDDARYAVLERLAHWQAALAMADDHPLLGVGFGNYEQAYPRYQLMNWPFPLGHAHNYYLNMLAETGIIGLIAYVTAWLIIFAMTLRLLAQTDGLQRGLLLGLLGVWTHLAVHSLFDKLYVNNLFLHIGAMLGLIGGLQFYLSRSATHRTSQK